MSNAPLISEKEEKALLKFKERISDVIRADHNDHMLVKWLRARRLNVGDAEAMYRKSIDWRKVNKIEALRATYVEPEVMTKYWTGGVCGQDKAGRPVQIDCFGKLDIRGVCASLSHKEIIRAIVFRMEHMLDYMKKESERQQKLINQVVLILDMDGFGRKHMWIPGAELISEFLRTLDNNYPEMLYKTYIINAPRLFHFAFNFVKPFLSEDTKNKFSFLGSNWKDELLKVIDAAELPVHFGGTKTDPDGDEYCKSLIALGGEVPVEFYKETESEDKERNCTSVRVKKGSVHKFDVQMDNSGIIKWYMKSDRDFNFAIMHKANDGAEQTVIQPMQWMRCSRMALNDSLVCQDAGIYTFVFDNNGSWWHDRNIKYNFEVETYESAEEYLQQRVVTSM